MLNQVFDKARLDEKSSFLVSLNTIFGRLRWLRMPFGISSASEEYQRKMLKASEGFERFAFGPDDILVQKCGDRKEDAEKENYDNLVKFQKNIKNNI